MGGMFKKAVFDTKGSRMAKLLIIDDDQFFYSPFVSYLADQGHECNIAENLSTQLC